MGHFFRTSNENLLQSGSVATLFYTSTDYCNYHQYSSVIG